MAAKRISSLLNLSSMNLSSNSSNTVNNTRRSPDQSMSAHETRPSPGRRNFSRPAGESSHNGSFSGSYPSSPSVAGTATANPHANQQQQQPQQPQQPQQQLQTPLSERGGLLQSPSPIDEETNGHVAGSSATRWGRLSRPSSRAASRSKSAGPSRSTNAVNEVGPDAQGEGQGRRNGRGWLRSRSRSRSTSNLKAGPAAWIFGLDKKIGYDVTPLLNADRVRFNLNHSSANMALCACYAKN